MHLRKLLVLGIFVAALGALAYWRLAVEPALAPEPDAPLLAGFDRARVRALRVDLLDRSLQLRVERDAADAWQIVDPLTFPAEPAVIEVLLDALASQRLRPAPGAEAGKVGLEPPRMVLEVEEDVGGKLLTRRIEIGAVDLDPQFAYVRIDQRLARTERALDTTLDRSLSDWRSHSLWSALPRDIVEIHRSAKPEARGVFPDLAHPFDAVLDGAWRATSPFQAQLDPEELGRWMMATVGMRASSFTDGAGELSSYGLEPPFVRLELVLADGRTEALRLAPEPLGELWYAAREGAPHVYRVDTDALVPVFGSPAGLVDRQIVRLARSEVRELQLAAGGRETRIHLEGGKWRVQGRVDGVEVLSDAAADPESIGDALSLLERTRTEELLPGSTLRDDEARGWIRVVCGDYVQGGVLGEPERSPDGVELVPFRRDGDGLLATVSAELDALARRDPRSWRTLELHKIVELEVSRVELARGQVTRAFARDDKGKWVRMGTTAEAKEFARWVDALLSVRAVELYSRGDEVLEDPITVRVVRYSGQATEFVLGDTAAPQGERVPVFRDGERFARVKPELAAGLRAILGTD